MAKRIAALLVVLLLLAGCGAADGWRGKVQEKNEWNIYMEVTSPVVDLQKTTGENEDGYFLLTEDELIKNLNARAAADGIPQLFDNGTSYFKWSATQEMLGFIRVELENNKKYVSNVKLELSMDTDEEAKIIGKYIYYLIDVFTENRAERISNTLLMFSKAPRGIPLNRILVCGNAVYDFKGEETYSDALFQISAAIDPEWKQQEKKPEEKFPIRPED